jgi:DNA repair protein RecO (recombination protein O)
LKAGAIWMPLTYFELWMTRLTGFLPELHVCVACGAALDGEKAYFHALVDGLLCADDKRLASSELTWESRKVAAEMFRAPVESLLSEAWPKKKGADLRKFLVQIMERHLDKKLVTAGMLAKIE